MATKTAKKVTPKKATATAKKVTAKKTTKKAAVKEVNVDFTNSVEAIKGTAKTINNEVLNAATDVLEDLRTNGTKLREVATNKVKVAMENATYENGVKFVKEAMENVKIENGVKFVKVAMENVKIENGVKFVKKTAKNVNKYSLETAEEILDGAVKNGQEWQGVAKKAVNGGLELAEKQQEITFEVLETLKGQLTTSAKRFGRLFSNN